MKQPFSWRIRQAILAELKGELFGPPRGKDNPRKETIVLRETVPCRRCKVLKRYLGDQIDVLLKTEAGRRDHHN